MSHASRINCSRWDVTSTCSQWWQRSHVVWSYLTNKNIYVNIWTTWRCLTLYCEVKSSQKAVSFCSFSHWDWLLCILIAIWVLHTHSQYGTSVTTLWNCRVWDATWTTCSRAVARHDVSAPPAQLYESEYLFLLFLVYWSVAS